MNPRRHRLTSSKIALSAAALLWMVNCGMPAGSSSEGSSRGGSRAPRTYVEAGHNLLRQIRVPAEFTLIRSYSDRSVASRQFIGPPRLQRERWTVPTTYSQEKDLSAYGNYSRTSGWKIVAAWFGPSPKKNDECALFLKVAREVRRVNSPLSPSETKAVLEGRRTLVEFSAACALDG